MRWWRKILTAGVMIITMLLAPLTANAASSPQGLLITPVRQYVTISPGQSQTFQLSLANITSNAVDVTLSMKQFSVADYTYDYTFLPAKENWVTFGKSQVHLAPGESQTVSYTVAVPQGATPGGHYFTLFATAALYAGAVKSNVQVTSVVYVTVNGNLTKTSQIKHSSLPTFSFGGDIPFSIDVRNTGNTHFFIYASGKLQGWTAKPAIDQGAHIILPGTTRMVGGTIAAPLLPGIYTAVYGYKVDDGHQVNTSQSIVYLPPWSIVLPIGLVWVVWLLVKRSKRK